MAVMVATVAVTLARTGQQVLLQVRAFITAVAAVVLLGRALVALVV